MERNFEFEEFCEQQALILGESSLEKPLYHWSTEHEGGYLIVFGQKRWKETNFKRPSQIKLWVVSILLEELENLYVHKTPIHKNVQ